MHQRKEPNVGNDKRCCELLGPNLSSLECQGMLMPSCWTSNWRFLRFKLENQVNIS